MTQISTHAAIRFAIAKHFRGAAAVKIFSDLLACGLTSAIAVLPFVKPQFVCLASSTSPNHFFFGSPPDNRCI